jgi:hypothetical protein
MFEEIADRLKPELVKHFRYKKPKGTDRARYYYTCGLIVAPKPIDAESLWNVLHEYAHALYHNNREIFGSDGIPNHVPEHECEEWARNRFRDEGILTPVLEHDSQVYLIEEARKDCKRCEGISDRALAYLTLAQRQVLQQEYEDYLIQHFPEPIIRAGIPRVQSWHFTPEIA